MVHIVLSPGYFTTFVLFLNSYLLNLIQQK